MRIDDLISIIQLAGIKRTVSEAGQEEVGRQDAVAKLKKLTAPDPMGGGNHAYVDPKTGTIMYSGNAGGEGNPSPVGSAKQWNDPENATAIVGRDLKNLLKQAGLQVTADAKGNARVDPTAFANLGKAPAAALPTTPTIVPGPPGSATAIPPPGQSLGAALASGNERDPNSGNRVNAQQAAAAGATPAEIAAGNPPGTNLSTPTGNPPGTNSSTPTGNTSMAGAAAWRPPAAPNTDVSSRADYEGDVNPSSGGGKPAMPNYSQDAAAKKKRQLMPVDPALKQVQSLLSTIPQLKELLGPYGADGRMGKHTRNAITTYLQTHPDDAAEPAFKAILDKYKIPVPNAKPPTPEKPAVPPTPEKPAVPPTPEKPAVPPTPEKPAVPPAVSGDQKVGRVDPRPPYNPRNPGPAQEWDKKYSATHHTNGTPKAAKTEDIELADLIRLVEKLK